MNVLEVDHVCHSYGDRPALDGISFELPPGCFMALVGPNGAGKTTLLSLIAGLLRPASGEIRVAGRSLSRDPLPALASMGFVFQDSALDRELTVLENLRFAAALHGLSGRSAMLRAEAELERFGLSSRRHDKARRLSGGQRRQLEIARALLHDPRLLVLDEPTTGLDVANRAALLARVRALCAERGLAVLWATHLLEEIGSGDLCLAISGGRAAWMGKAGDLTGDHRSAAAALARLQEAAP